MQSCRFYSSIVSFVKTPLFWVYEPHHQLYIQKYMAAVPSSHSFVYTDNTSQIAKGKRENVLYHVSLKGSVRQGQTVAIHGHIMLEASIFLGKNSCMCHPVVYLNPRNDRRLRTIIKAAKNTEKHLKSLDSYIGKLQNDSKLPTFRQMTELSGKENKLKSEDGLRLVDDYLGKVKELENYIRENVIVSVNKPVNIDRGSGRLSASEMDMKLKADKVEIERKSTDGSSDLYIIGALASLNIATFLFEVATPVKNSTFELFSIPSIYGAKINNLILTGEWWRLVTPMFLHSGIFHMALGIWILFTFGTKVAREYGSFTFLLIYILGGISANLISFLHTPEPIVAGTGPVFAVIGAWLIYQVQNKNVVARDASESMLRKAVIAAALICVLSNFDPIDDWSHFAATFTGVAYGFVTCPTLQVKDASSEAQPERMTLVRRYADPCRSLLYFSISLALLSSLLFVIEPPLDLID